MENLEASSFIQDKTPTDKSSFTTLFSLINFQFSELKYTSENQIPTEPFIKFCKDIRSLIEEFKLPSLSKNGYLVAKDDFFKNLKRIKENYLKDKEKNHTLQLIILNEIKEKIHKKRDSSTNAILWTTRSILFLREILHQYAIKNNDDFIDAAHKAYKHTLKRHHNWIIVNFFNCSLKLMPVKKEDTLVKFAHDANDYLTNKTIFESQVIEEVKVTIKSIDSLIDSVRLFCIFKNLDL